MQRLSSQVITVILAGCAISLVGFGVRSSFGLFLEPMTVALGLLAALIHIPIDERPLARMLGGSRKSSA